MYINKNIDLCGLGNGLVDLQYEVDEKELSYLGLTKGEMRLVTITEQQELLKKLSGKKHYKCSGGSAANTIIAFSHFGGTAAYSTVLGDDEFGAFYSNEFKEMQIELAALKLKQFPTGTCIVLITPDSERTMHTCLAATANFNIQHLREDFIKNSKWLYLEGYKFSEESSTQAIYKAVELAQKYNTQIALTFSDYFITENFREHVKWVAKRSDLIFCNEYEAKSLTETNNYKDAFKALCSISKNVCMTLGANGSKVLWNKDSFEVEAYNTSAIDSTGAGDIFAAGFLYGIIKENNPKLAAHLGSLSASRVVAQFGARLKDNHKSLRDEIILKFR